MHKEKYPNEEDKYAEILNRVTKVAESLEKIANVYASTNLRKKEDLDLHKKNFIQKFWYRLWHRHKNSRHFGTYVLIILSLTMLWFNWRNDIDTTRYNQIERVVDKKEARQREIVNAITKARALVLNQIILCKETNMTQAKMKEERNNVLVPLISSASGIKNVFNNQVSEKIIELEKKIDTINNVCRLDENEFDNQSHVLSHQIILLMNESIFEDRNGMNKLTIGHEHLGLPEEIKP